MATGCRTSYIATYAGNDAYGIPTSNKREGGQYSTMSCIGAMYLLPMLSKASCKYCAEGIASQDRSPRRILVSPRLSRNVRVGLGRLMQLALRRILPHLRTAGHQSCEPRLGRSCRAARSCRSRPAFRTDQGFPSPQGDKRPAPDRTFGPLFAGHSSTKKVSGDFPYRAIRPFSTVAVLS